MTPNPPPITLAPNALDDVPVIALIEFLRKHELVIGSDLVIRKREEK